jgi:hypothetical protein
MVGEPVLEDDRRWISTNPCTLPENYSAAVRLGFSRGTHVSLGRAGQRATQAFDSNWLLRWLSLVASQYDQQLHVLQSGQARSPAGASSLWAACIPLFAHPQVEALTL